MKIATDYHVVQAFAAEVRKRNLRGRFLRGERGSLRLSDALANTSIYCCDYADAA